jgi:hypothetical protein
MGFLIDTGTVMFVSRNPSRTFLNPSIFFFLLYLGAIPIGIVELQFLHVHIEL